MLTVSFSDGGDASSFLTLSFGDGAGPHKHSNAAAPAAIMMVVENGGKRRT